MTASKKSKTKTVGKRRDEVIVDDPQVVYAITIDEVLDRYLRPDGRATAVVGLPEEVTAMLFAFFSRSKHTVRDSLKNMILDGNLEPPPEPPDQTTEKARGFHERTTLGFGHKSVADHATVHFSLENVSMVVERDFMEARLLAATSKSTRFVNFRDAGYVTPDHWPDKLRGEFDNHVEALLKSYEKLIPVAVQAIRKLLPYDELAQQTWKREEGWAAATEKRALDMVRDVLPACMKTSFGVTTSATGLRELLDKRQSGGPIEVQACAAEVRSACRAVLPTLLPAEYRIIHRHDAVTVNWRETNRYRRPPIVNMVFQPAWEIVQAMTGCDLAELVGRWMAHAHHMPPDRSAEFAVYGFDTEMSWAIHRDLGRHRMMTQISSLPSPHLGYGCDPLLRGNHANDAMAMVAASHMAVLKAADERLRSWTGMVSPTDLQYAMPLAAMVNVKWLLNLREFVHLGGLRSTPQGHPSYREVAQAAGRAVAQANPMLRGLVEDVVNFEDIIVGRPG